MKILYIAPNTGHQIAYASAIYREMHDITVLTDSLSFHLKRLSTPDFENSFRNVKGPFFLGLIRKLICSYPLSDKIKNFINKLIDISYFYYLKKLKIEKFDIVISYRDMGLEFINEFKESGSKWIVDEVNTHPDFFTKYLYREGKKIGIKDSILFSKDRINRIKKAYEKSDAILLPSKHVYKTIKRRVKKNKKFILNPYGCPYPVINKKNSNLEKIHLVCLAKLHYRKGIRYLLKVFEKIDEKYPNKYDLKIIGGSTSHKGFDRTYSNKKIKFLGLKKKDQIKMIFKNSHIFILPTLEESQALVIGEALSHGLPVISTPFSGAFDYVLNKDLLDYYKNNFSIQIINPNNLDQFSNAIMNISTKKNYLKASQGALSIAANNTWYNSGQSLVKKLELFL